MSRLFNSLIFLFCLLSHIEAYATSCTQVGDTLFCDNGTSYNQVGDTTFGSDGTSCTQVGDTIFCN